MKRIYVTMTDVVVQGCAFSVSDDFDLTDDDALAELVMAQEGLVEEYHIPERHVEVRELSEEAR